MPMDPRIAELLDELDAYRRALEEAVARVPVHLRQTSPALGRWSVAEVLQHLAAVEGRSGEVFAALAEAAPTRAPGDDPEVSPTAHRVDLVFLLDRSQHRKAPEQLHPEPGVDAAAAWERLRRVREATRAAVLAADGRALETVSRPHPALGVLNAYQWIAAMGGHEARHTAQVREAAEMLAGEQGFAVQA